MLARVFAWFERRIPVFAPFDKHESPPPTAWAFTLFYLRGTRLWLTLLLSVSLLHAAVEAGIILLIGWFVDILTKATAETIWAENGQRLLVLALILLILQPTLTLIHFALAGQTIMPNLGSRIGWRTHLYTLQHQLAYFQNELAGRIANRIVQVGPAIRDIVVQALEAVVYVLGTALVTLGAFTAISVWLAIPVAVWLICYATLSRYFLPRLQTRSLEVSRARSRFVGHIVDTYAHIATIKLFTRTISERGALRRALGHYVERTKASLRLHTTKALFLSVLNTGLLVAVGGVALMLWSRGRMTPGEAAAGLALVMRLSQMSSWFMQVIRSASENIGIIRESIETISRPDQEEDIPGALRLRVSRGEIDVRDINFSYGGRRMIIKHLSLNIQPGEKLGLVGPSASGKSTLVRLLSRELDPASGRILIDEQDIAKVTYKSLREQIAIVTQESSLLHRSIRENIAYGKPSATQAEIELAARQALAHDFILDLEDEGGRHGYSAHIGEEGIRLSGGQRQRIALARAILKDAPILVLDDATSAIDSENEAKIWNNLTESMPHRTIIIIAQRLSTVASLDRIAVMEQGEIVEQGRHSELVEGGGFYSRLWKLQSGATEKARVAG